MLNAPHIVVGAHLTPKKLGSIEYQLFEVAREAIHRGAKVDFVFSGPVPSKVREHFSLPGQPSFVALPPPTTPDGRKQWAVELARLRADVYWLHFLPVVGSVIPTVRRDVPAARIVLTDHVSRGFAKQPLWRATLSRWRAAHYAKSVDHYIAVSDFIAKRLRGFDRVPADRITTVHNGVDLQRFSADTERGDHLTSVTYMRPEKGTRVFLEALAVLKERGMSPQCFLLGEGPELERHRQYASESGLTQVQFPGERLDVPSFFRGARAAVVPSLWPEAFGLAAAEALAMGVPVVASRVGGLQEVVEDGVSGYLVPPGDHEALADALERFIRDPDHSRQMGQAGRRRAEALFDLRDCVRRITDVLLN